MVERDEKQGLEQSGNPVKDTKLQSKEGIGPLVDVTVFKLGGTWDMTLREGKRVGMGGLDDDELKRIQQSSGLFSAITRSARIDANIKLSREIHRRFQVTQPEPVDASEHLSSWCHDEDTGESFGDFAKGEFLSLFSGDSVHLKPSIIAPMIVTLLEKARHEPVKPLLGGQGTDTADIAILSLYDVLTFDTKLPPLVLTGSNTPHESEGSDAPRNFIDLARVAHADLQSGAYWVFHGYLYQASDLIKIDPEETRRIEGQSTFYAPHQNVQPINALFLSGRKSNRERGQAPHADHIVCNLKSEDLYEALSSVYVADLGNQNAGWMDMERIFDPSVKAVIVAAHGSVVVDNETRMDLVNAAKNGKLVVGVSRALIGGANDGYEASLLGANENSNELGGTGKRIISAHKLNKTISRALVTRALLEGLDQEGTQKLFDAYASSRNMV